MYKVKIADIKEFQENRERWNHLTLVMNIPSIFCTWEWIYTWWEHFGNAYEPLILFIYKDTELKGILPLAFHKTTSIINNLNNSSIGRILSYCGSIELYPDHLDIICPKEEANPCLDAVFDFLSSEYRNWDVLQISLLTDGSNLLSYFNKGNKHFDSAIKQSSVAPFISLSDNFGEYIKKFNSKQRYNIKSRQTKLYEQFGVKYIACNPSQIFEGLKTLFHLHELRAKRKDIMSTFKGPHLFNFHYALSQRISKHDWIWLRFLKTKEEIISVAYGIQYGKHLFYYQIGLNPEWERYGPGAVLIYEVIQEAFSRNYKEFDFLRGNEEYKKTWTQNHRALFDMKIYNRTLCGNFSKIIFSSRNMVKRYLNKP